MHLDIDVNAPPRYHRPHAVFPTGDARGAVPGAGRVGAGSYITSTISTALAAAVLIAFWFAIEENRTKTETLKSRGFFGAGNYLIARLCICLFSETVEVYCPQFFIDRFSSLVN
jgi:hypothetical protein